jgi:hypothetical protein
VELIVKLTFRRYAALDSMNCLIFFTLKGWQEGVVFTPLNEDFLLLQKHGFVLRVERLQFPSTSYFDFGIPLKFSTKFGDNFCGYTLVALSDRFLTREDISSIIKLPFKDLEPTVYYFKEDVL